MSKMIGIRISKVEKKHLAEVAKIKGVSLSDFLRSAAVTEAHRCLPVTEPTPERNQD